MTPPPVHGPLDLSAVRIDPAWALRVPAALAMRRLALPLCVVDGALAVAMADPGDAATVEAIARAAGMPVSPVPADPDALRPWLLRVYGDIRTASAAGLAPAAAVPADPVALVDALLRAAALRAASDIHIDPFREDARVRLRVDGRLEELLRIPSALLPAVCSRVKVMSGLDIAEKRAPQDGAFSWRLPGTDLPPFDVRVATLPVRFGERITLRLLETGGERLSIDDLGMAPAHRAQFERILESPHGLVVLAGPTGAGKTTTLYAAIQALLQRAELSILTVEDPVEYEIEGVAQVEVDSGDKVNFSKALRSLLRHDPDVIMIGEIRDAESLDTAVKAALTGHLVLSTLHANDAPGAVTRLLDMGLEPHLAAATLRLSVAQRLVRRLCPHCREEATLDEASALALGRPALAGRTVFRPRGCLACAGRGTRGRIGLFEMFTPDSDLAALIARGSPGVELQAALRARKVPSLADDAMDKLLAGVAAAEDLAAAATADAW
ncbi:MAG: GspE/PulE family protein [Kiritimatiellia bacterium]